MKKTSFQHLLKAARESRGLSRRELAEMAGLTVRAISGFETGEYGPRVKTLYQLASALEVTIWDLVPSGERS